jgi:NAD(P)-dependent dehydrogenase (short-subunit alcohol dehydrogenase family)
MNGEKKPLFGKNILITGGAVRVGREIGLALAAAGANMVIHFNNSVQEAIQTQKDIEGKGVRASLIQADLSDPDAAAKIIDQAGTLGPLDGLINNASIFDAIEMDETSLEDWKRHLDINLTAPFLLTQAFAKLLGKSREGRIINILDWRALRPGTDHFPYTISKAGLAAMTQASAQALAPNIMVNGIAFGAILPPSDGGDTESLLEQVPANRWAKMSEVGETVRFLLEGPAYITGEIIHLDGGRHLI